MLRLGILTLILASTLAGPAAAMNAAAAGQSQQRGLFGTVSVLSGDHPRAVAGETDITLDTAQGTVEITATPGTAVRVPGLEQPSLEDVSVGDAVAVLASNGQAVSILVKPGRPVRVRHFTGIVTAVEEDGAVSILDGRGRQISASALTGVLDLGPGDLVTAVLEQDLATGSLLITGLENAMQSLDRIESAMEKAQRSKADAKLAALRQRLADNSTRHLTLLQEVTQKITPSLRPQLQLRLESARGSYARGLSRFDAGRPSARVSGIVTSIDEGRGQITIEPAGLAPVDLTVTGDTRIEFRGKETGFGQLDLASRVEAQYDLETRSTSRIRVLPGETLENGPAQALLAAEDRGGMTGTVIGLDLTPTGPQTITVRDADTSGAVTLVVSGESVILAGGTTAELGRELLDSRVTAIFDQESLGLIELDTLADDPGPEFLSGVVHSFVSKVLPGNFSVLTREGQVRTFTRTDETVIRRDGRQVSINEVRLGDLVRANTRLAPPRAPDGAAAGPAPALAFLSLKSPPPASIRGTIRGISSSPQGDVRITISTNRLDVVSLIVNGDTGLTQQGRAIGPGALAVGQRVLSGTYDPITGRAEGLVLQPSRTAQVNREITSVEEERMAIAVATREGEPVRVAPYDPATNQSLKLVLG